MYVVNVCVLVFGGECIVFIFVWRDWCLCDWWVECWSCYVNGCVSDWVDCVWCDWLLYR